MKSPLISEIINSYSQLNTTYEKNAFSEEELKEIKLKANENRILIKKKIIGANIFSYLEKQKDIVLVLHAFPNSEIDSIIISDAEKFSKKYIIINNEIPLINQIFAAAHELYHYNYSLKKQNSYVFYPNQKEVEKEEIKANRFAAELLLSSEYLKKEINTFISNSKVSSFNLLPFDNQKSLCIQISIKYALPLKAVMFRLEEEGYISNLDYMLNEYSTIKESIFNNFNDLKKLKNLYSTQNNYIKNPLYKMLPSLFKKGKLNFNDVNQVISLFNLDKKKFAKTIKEDIKNTLSDPNFVLDTRKV